MSVAAAAAAAAVVVVVVVVVTRAWKFEPTIKKKGCPDVAFYSVRKDAFVNKPHETTIDPGLPRRTRRSRPEHYVTRRAHDVMTLRRTVPWHGVQSDSGPAPGAPVAAITCTGALQSESIQRPRSLGRVRMCFRCAGTRPGPGSVDLGPDQMCRHTDKTLFLVVPAHFAPLDLPAHCAGTRYLAGGRRARIFFPVFSLPFIWPHSTQLISRRARLAQRR